MKISFIQARQIFDSRGYPTVECEVELEDGSTGRSAVPSGASTGSGEALELRDGGKAYSGKGVLQAVKNIHEIIAPDITGYESWDQFKLDTRLKELDGTDNKSQLGANAILAVSLAVAHAHAAYEKTPLYEHIAAIAGNDTNSLPMPLFNIFNGGAHAAGSTDIQEFMIVPVGTDSLGRALQMASETYHALGKILREKSMATTVGDEGGFAPHVTRGTEEALELIETAIGQAGYRLGLDIAIALDVAASELIKENDYIFAQEHKQFTSQGLIDWYDRLTNQHPIISIEDGLGEKDWPGWQAMTSRLGKHIQLVGDDLFVTNSQLLQRGINEQAGNAILIKPNQIGTLTETIQAVNTAQKAGWQTIISHRSGETEDISIAHLAVGLNAGQIKTGSFARSERIAKYNELLRISETLGSQHIQNPFV